MEPLRLLVLERAYESWLCEENETLSYLMEMYFDDNYNYRIHYYPRSLMLYSEMIDEYK